MLLGNHKQFKGQGFVCFVDVLGFSEDILANWGAAGQGPLEKILAVKQQMPIFSEDDGDHGSAPTARTYVCRVSTVSDSVTICFGFDPHIIVGDLVLGLEALLANVKHIWRSFVGYGYTIRGAIDFGPIYWDEQELIGPALINAYRLESSIARTSRVILSSAVNKVLVNLAERHGGNLTEHLLDQFRIDADGYLIVDPHQIVHDEAERGKLLKEVCAIRDKLPPGIIREKYTPLISMLSYAAPARISASQLGKY